MWEGHTILPPPILRRCYVLFVVNMGWVIFRTDTLKNAILYIRNMFGSIQGTTGYTLLSYLDRWTALIFVGGLFCATALPIKISNALYAKFNEKIITVIRYLLLILIFVASIFRIVAGTYNPFIYFRF